jgi:hypothetical protein
MGQPINLIDRTNTEFVTESDFKHLFVELVTARRFGVDKIVDVKVSPIAYVIATYMRTSIPNPMRIVFGDYQIRLHC